MNQGAFAKKSRVARTYASEIEGGRRNPTLKTMVKMARALKVSMAQLTKNIHPPANS
jgi:transcriptional regulator with XRE-family HTH domain